MDLEIHLEARANDHQPKKSCFHKACPCNTGSVRLPKTCTFPIFKTSEILRSMYKFKIKSLWHILVGQLDCPQSDETSTMKISLGGGLGLLHFFTARIWLILPVVISSQTVFNWDINFLGGEHSKLHSFLTQFQASLKC